MNIYETEIDNTQVHVLDCDSLIDYRAFHWAIRTEDLGDNNKTMFVDMATENGNYCKHNAKEGWYGDAAKVDLHEMATVGISQFIDTPLLNALYARVESLVPSSVSSKFKKKKFKFNRNFGVFSFDRASAGLYWLDEFYCQAEGRAVAVSETQLDSIDQNGSLHRYMKSTHSPVTEVSAAHFGNFPNSIPRPIGRKESRIDGTPFVRTTTEDVFVYFPQSAKQSKSVMLCINAMSDNKSTWQQMAFSGIASAILSNMFEKAGVKTAVTVFYSARKYSTRFLTKGGNPNYRFKTPSKPNSSLAVVIPVKKFEDTVDINAIALFSDSRFTRFEVLGNMVKISDMLGRNTDYAIGYPWSNSSKDLESTKFYNNNPTYADITRIHVPSLKSEAEVINFITKIANGIIL